MYIKFIDENHRYIQPTNHTPYLHNSLEAATSKMGDQPIQFGGLSIKKGL